MSGFQHKVMRHTKRQEKKSEETKQSSASDSNMTPILELTGKEFKIITINMLRALMGKKDNMKYIRAMQIE